MQDSVWLKRQKGRRKTKISGSKLEQIIHKIEITDRDSKAFIEKINGVINRLHNNQATLPDSINKQQEPTTLLEKLESIYSYQSENVCALERVLNRLNDLI